MAVSVCTPLFILTQLLSLLFTVLMYINDEMDFESCLCILCVCVCEFECIDIHRCRRVLHTYGLKWDLRLMLS